MTKIALLGDYRAGYPPHEQAITALAALQTRHPHQADWVPTASLADGADAVLAGYAGVWAGSGPYLSKAGILNGIGYARQRDLPFLGTCSGFGYTVLEFARSQFGLAEVHHPTEKQAVSADVQFLHPLAVCGIGTHEISFRTRPGTKSDQLYRTDAPITEWSNCSYGIHPQQVARFAECGLHVAAADDAGEAKLVELAHNRLFMAMLFYPQLNSVQPHPILRAFVEAASNTPAH
jgi:CTP synthase (UTP-ammonia lyase)